MVELFLAMKHEHILQQLAALPATPGAYLLKDIEGNVLYVGKAANLHQRVASYFQSTDKLPPRQQKMVPLVHDLDFFLTDSEQEALILESNLIKQHEPHYNVRLKDGKTYPYLKIDLTEDWPRVYLTRRPERDGAEYFGPFASAGSVRRTLALLKKIFLFRSCKKPITGMDTRPCLEYHIGRCLGPCISAVSKEEYKQAINQVMLFLGGKHEVLARELRGRMTEAAENLDFEKAAMLRDQIRAVESVVERQKIASADGEMDIIAFSQANEQAYVMVFLVRSGKLLGKQHFMLTGTKGEEPFQVMTSFVQQFYSSAPFIPREILLQYPLEEVALFKKWLEGLRGGKVEVRVPRRGMKKDLVDMVTENARRGLEQMRVKLLAQPDVLAAALDDLQKGLSLPGFPHRVECYDVSNIQGAHAAGSMVVFEAGLPKKAQYRRFRIRAVEGANDCAMIQEVLRRRFKRGASGSQDSPWATFPDLVLVDGGKGQLNAALQSMKEVGADWVPCASIAKQDEAVFLPGLADPVMLPRDSAALYFLQRIRDEAHRFALGYFHKVHRRVSLVSSLEAIPGVGAKRRRALLKRFGSAKRIKEATLEELASVKGMNKTLAGRVRDHL